MRTEIELDPELTVNEVIRRIPAAVSVFSRHGIDTCCGGDLSVDEAARRHGVDPEKILEEVRGSAG